MGYYLLVLNQNVIQTHKVKQKRSAHEFDLMYKNNNTHYLFLFLFCYIQISEANTILSLLMILVVVAAFFY